MLKKLAICIPTYNRISELERQVNFFISEISDDKSEIEFFISDNNSSDNTKKYLNEISKNHPWINVIYNETNNGLVGNLYELLKNSEIAEYIWFVSDDDIFKTGVVKEIINILKNNDDIGSVFINSELWIHNENYDLIKEVDKFVPNEKAGLRNDKFVALSEIFKKKNTSLMWISAWVIRREAVSEIKKLDFKNLFLTEPFLFAANSVNYGSIYITTNIYLKNGTKLASTWVSNHLAVFKVHFIGFFYSILLMKNLGYKKVLINDFTSERVEYLIKNSPKYFIWGILFARKLSLKIFFRVSIILNMKILNKLFHYSFKKIYLHIFKKVLILRGGIKELEYGLLNKFSSKRKIESKNNNPQYVVSLTTFPARIKKVYIVIESILSQNLLPDKIILWLSKEEFEGFDTLPKSLISLKERGLEINFVDDNFKPYKKLIYAYASYPNSTIITVDDDVIYPKNWLNQLISNHKKEPKVTISYLCKEIELLKDSNQLKPYGKWRPVSKTIPSYNNFPIGAYGVLYPPNSLNELISNSELFIKLCPNQDDIWFKAMAMLNGTMAKQISEKQPYFYAVRNTEETALFHTNVGNGMNDLSLKKVFSYFDSLNSLIS